LIDLLVSGNRRLWSPFGKGRKRIADDEPVSFSMLSLHDESGNDSSVEPVGP
jgi:hypothetical protein